MANVNISLYHDAGFSSSQLRSLEALLARNPSVHWITLNSETGIYEMVLDNSLMSCFRSCPQLFMYTWVEGYAGTGRSWILEFGSLFHKMVEFYYQDFRKKDFDVSKWAIQRAAYEWAEAKMDVFSQNKEYILIGGITGFCTLLLAYSARFSADNERLRVIGTEIAFGRNKEVPLGSLYTNISINPMYRAGASYNWLDIFLAGRIDVLVDDGSAICPLDHKTKGTLRNDPAKYYEIDEGPTGYIYAVSKILPKLVSEMGIRDEAILQRSCNKILMNYISKAPTADPTDRFRRLPIFKSEDQLESYRIRMLNTAEDIFHALIRYASTGQATRNTGICTNHFGSDCGFLPVDRQSTKEAELVVLKANYKKGVIWNTENPNPKENIENGNSDNSSPSV